MKTTLHLITAPALLCIAYVAQAEPTAAALSPTDDDTNATIDRQLYNDNGESFWHDRFKITETIRARVDSLDTGASYTGMPNPDHNTVSHLNADLWLSARIAGDWQATMQIEPQLNLETGQLNGDDDIPMNKLFLQGTVHDKIKTRLGKFGAFSSYGRLLDNEVTGAEVFFDYPQLPTKVTLGRVTKQLNDNSWGVGVHRELIGAVQSVYPVNEKTNIGSTIAYLKNVQRQNGNIKDAVMGEVGVDVHITDDWQWMAAYSRSNIDDTRDTADKKVVQDGFLTQIRYKLADWKVRNSWDAYLNLRRVGAMSGVSSVEDYSKNVQGAQIGFNYVPYPNLKFGAFYLHGKQVNATAGADKENVRVVRAQLEYTF